MLLHVFGNSECRVTRLGEFSPTRHLFTLAHFFEIYRSSPNLFTAFSAEKNNVLILTKNGLGYILVDILTNSSGHSAPSGTF
jgi:hypothetical protein